MSRVSLTMTGAQREMLMNHLFPPDHREAVAIALCGTASSPHGRKLLVHRVIPVPHTLCSVRTVDQVTWPTEFLVPLIDEASRKNWSVVKIHGHDSYKGFSTTDDNSDTQLFPSIYAWDEGDAAHASVVMLRDGSAIGRIVTAAGEFQPLYQVAVIGDDIDFYARSEDAQVPEFGTRIAQSFGAGTFERLRKLRVAVVGASGTGSPVIEQLARNCVGELVIVDPDVVEVKNLNRILNASLQDAVDGRAKVEVAARAVRNMGLGTKVQPLQLSLFDANAVRAVASCDVVFGCMDSIDGRFLLNKLASFYLLPYFDLGVKLVADGRGGVSQVAGSVHYLKPGGSSLLSRHVISLEQVRVAGIKRTEPERYKHELQEGYIQGIEEDRPAVVQLNSLIASLAVNELLARLHPFRLDPNSDFAITRVSISHAIWDHEPDGDPCKVISRHLGRGDTWPLLDWAELSAS